MNEIKKKIINWLSEPVPGSSNTPGPQRDWWISWNQRCKDFGSDAPPLLIEALRSGDRNAQNAALLGLRHHGYETLLKGFGDDEYYIIRKVGESEWTRIEPKIKYSDDPGITISGVKPKNE